MSVKLSHVGITVVSIALVLGVGIAIPQLTKNSPESIVMIGEASYPKSYDSVLDLASDSDLVVTGTVLNESNSQDAENVLIITDHKVRVDSLLRGYSSTIITVRQTGGSVRHRTLIDSSDPQMKSGDEYVLFLREFEPGKYVTLGGPQGRLLINNGLARSIESSDAITGHSIVEPLGRLGDLVDQSRDRS